jgi:hypothetical protein
MRKRLFLAGANRGGREFSRSYNLDRFSIPSQVIIADPKPERANRLANYWQNQGVDAIGYTLFCEELIKDIPEDTVGMLSIDTIYPMVNIIEKRTDLSLQWQIIGRSAGRYGVVLGFCGTITKGDNDTRSASTLILANLTPFSTTVSSQNISEDILNASAIQFTRRAVSTHSAECISSLMNDNTLRSKLYLFFSDTRFPLIVRKGVVEPFKETKKRALEVEDPRIDEAGFAVAVVLINRIEIFIIERQSRIGRVVSFHTTFGIAPRLSPQFEPAIVTD